MRRTRVQMTMAALLAAALMSGCGEEPYELTENEQALIANYSAHIVTKYNAYQKEGLSAVEQESTEAAATETEELKEDTKAPSEEPEAIRQNDAAESAAKENSTEEAYVPATLEELFGASGIALAYAGASLTDGYMEGSYYVLYPDAGKQYLVLQIEITNNGSEPAAIDYLSDTAEFQVKLNGEIISPAEQTVLMDDFSSLNVTLDAGETKQSVLLFQVPGEVTTVDSVELLVTTDKNYQILLEND